MIKGVWLRHSLVKEIIIQIKATRSVDYQNRNNEMILYEKEEKRRHLYIKIRVALKLKHTAINKSPEYVAFEQKHASVRAELFS